VRLQLFALPCRKSPFFQSRAAPVLVPCWLCSLAPWASLGEGEAGWRVAAGRLCPGWGLRDASSTQSQAASSFLPFFLFKKGWLKWRKTGLPFCNWGQGLYEQFCFEESPQGWKGPLSFSSFSSLGSGIPRMRSPALREGQKPDSQLGETRPANLGNLRWNTDRGIRGCPSPGGTQQALLLPGAEPPVRSEHWQQADQNPLLPKTEKKNVTSSKINKMGLSSKICESFSSFSGTHQQGWWTHQEQEGNKTWFYFNVFLPILNAAQNEEKDVAF